MMAGPQFTPQAYYGTPLDLLLPIDIRRSDEPPRTPLTDDFQASPTELGLASPPLELGDTPEETRRIWSELPGFYWLYPAAQLRPAARVLAEHPTRLLDDGRHLPVLALQYVGAGKVLFHATDETWRWRYRVGDIYFARYWVQTLRYLSRSKLLGKDRLAELTADRREYQRGEAARLRVRFLDDRRAPADNDGVSLIVEHRGRKQSQHSFHGFPPSRILPAIAKMTLGDYVYAAMMTSARWLACHGMTRRSMRSTAQNRMTPISARITSAANIVGRSKVPIDRCMT